MDNIIAAKTLKELGHPTRISIIKELIKYGEAGMAVGELQKILSIPNSTLSHHISALISVGLITQQRQGTTLLCSAQVNNINNIAKFLVDECCIYSNKNLDNCK